MRPDIFATLLLASAASDVGGRRPGKSRKREGSGLTEKQWIDRKRKNKQAAKSRRRNRQ